jgi:hypothetical protein
MLLLEDLFPRDRSGRTVNAQSLEGSGIGDSGRGGVREEVLLCQVSSNCLGGCFLVRGEYGH